MKLFTFELPSNTLALHHRELCCFSSFCNHIIALCNSVNENKYNSFHHCYHSNMFHCMHVLVLFVCHALYTNTCRHVSPPVICVKICHHLPCVSACVTTRHVYPHVSPPVICVTACQRVSACGIGYFYVGMC